MKNKQKTSHKSTKPIFVPMGNRTLEETIETIKSLRKELSKLRKEDWPPALQL